MTDSFELRRTLAAIPIRPVGTVTPREQADRLAAVGQLLGLPMRADESRPGVFYDDLDMQDHPLTDLLSEVIQRRFPVAEDTE